MKTLTFSILCLVGFLFSSSSFADEGTLNIAGTLAPGMKVSYIKASYSSGCHKNGTDTEGKISTNGLKFKASVKFKDYIPSLINICSKELAYVELGISRIRKELGQLYNEKYTITFFAKENAPLMQLGDVAANTVSEENAYFTTYSPELPKAIAFGKNEIKNLNFTLKESIKPIIDDANIYKTFNVNDWKMSFTLYKNALGQVGTGSILKVISKKSKMPSGYYKINRVETWSRGNLNGEFYIAGYFTDKEGNDWLFNFAPRGAVNSFYDNCKPTGPQANLTIYDANNEDGATFNYCSYTATQEH